jgi:hypothetical protein
MYAPVAYNEDPMHGFRLWRVWPTLKLHEAKVNEATDELIPTLSTYPSLQASPQISTKPLQLLIFLISLISINKNSVTTGLYLVSPF